MAFTNADKSKHGTSAQNGIEDMLNYCKECEYIVNYKKNYRIGKSGYENTKQFYVPFLVEFYDGEKWALFSTTSMRTDRIKGQQWDALNVKQIDASITTAILVYDDSVSENEKIEFVRQNTKYQTHYEYSEIDAILSQDAVNNAIEAKALSEIGTGKAKDKQGRSFEMRVEKVMNSSDNLKRWKTNDQRIVGLHFALFECIVSTLGLDSSRVERIEATVKIPKLPTGGSPKTDVLITVCYEESKETFGISCKRTSEVKVSVHQYNADSFANVLDANNENLRCLLNGFQAAANMRDFGEENCEALTKALDPYAKKLFMWVLGGIGGEGDPNVQWANYLLVYSNTDGAIKFHSINEYYEILMSSKLTGNFGTPFSWTYPSGRRGKDIQLKCRIL